MQRKRVISFSLFVIPLILTFILLFEPVVYSLNNQEIKVNVDVLNVRSGPGLNYDVIAKVNQDQQYPILEEKDSWFKIKMEQKDGWVASWLVEKITTSSSSTTKTAESNVTNLNVRKGPSITFSVIDQIQPGTKYPIIDEEGDWVNIQLNPNKNGWIAKWLTNISVEVPSENTLQSDLITIQANLLNVRKGPSTDETIIGMLTKNDQVQVVDIEEGWYKIKYKDGFGWIASKYASEIAKNKTDEKTSNSNNKRVIVNTDILNLREGPSLDNPVVTKLNKGDVLIVLDSKGDWFKISKESDPTIVGWVANWLVVDFNPIISNQPTVIILNPGTNLREGPSTDFNVVARADVGQQLPIIAKEGDWYKIELPDGKQAYVAGWIVSVKGFEQNIKHGVEKLLDGKVIVIDAGHGGNDRGATGMHFKSIEKELNLTVAVKLQKKLEAAGAKVIMTRTDDTKIPLQERVDIAANNKADAFISIHHNTNDNSMVNGTITYYHDSGDRELADFIQEELVNKAGTQDLDSRYGDYFVIRENTQVAVLIELAFISNYQDELKARSKYFQENAAEGIFQGIIKYFNVDIKEEAE